MNANYYYLRDVCSKVRIRLLWNEERTHDEDVSRYVRMVMTSYFPLAPVATYSNPSMEILSVCRDTSI
jgi:hypothetical protein